MWSRRIAVCLEVTTKQTFASALDWPGWCCAGRDEGAAVEALASYAERYAPVVEQAGLSFPSTVAFDVVERVPGGETPSTLTRRQLEVARLVAQGLTNKEIASRLFVSERTAPTRVP